MTERRSSSRSPERHDRGRQPEIQQNQNRNETSQERRARLERENTRNLRTVTDTSQSTSDTNRRSIEETRRQETTEESPQEKALKKIALRFFSPEERQIQETPDGQYSMNIMDMDIIHRRAKNMKDDLNKWKSVLAEEIVKRDSRGEVTTNLKEERELLRDNSEQVSTKHYEHMIKVWQTVSQPDKTWLQNTESSITSMRIMPTQEKMREFEQIMQGDVGRSDLAKRWLGLDRWMQEWQAELDRRQTMPGADLFDELFGKR